MFHVSASVPVSETLSQVSDLPGLAKFFAEDAATVMLGCVYLTAMGKAVIDDVKTLKAGK
ncbi:DUF3077 domain-containing protein [Pseudomonas sp. NPDC087614]|uniref:DUF3077 domain-containing protein n=1 Tax=Pseudomonas sp. NPDC087614 TaxID=3364442 RepID=UPI0038136F81